MTIQCRNYLDSDILMPPVNKACKWISSLTTLALSIIAIVAVHGGFGGLGLAVTVTALGGITLIANGIRRFSGDASTRMKFLLWTLMSIAAIVAVIFGSLGIAGLVGSQVVGGTLLAANLAPLALIGIGCVWAFKAGT